MGKETCEICQLLKENSKLILYKDDNVAAMLAPKPASAGHMLIFPVEHFPILEHVPDFVVSEIFSAVNKLSVAVFDSIPMHGTNVILQNGTGAGQKMNHCIIHVIPRQQGDKINLEWQPKQLSEEEMSTIELKIKEETKNIGGFEKQKEEPIEIEESTEKLTDSEDGEENYLLKQLRRIP